MSGELPRTGELTPDNVRGALGLPRRESEAASQLTMPRPPALCQGCGHRDVYTALNDVLREHYPNHKGVISDNLTTGMTGGQDSAGTGRLEQICAGLGVEPEHIRVVVPLPKNMEEIRRTIREEIEYKGVSVIIPRRECIQTAKRHNAKKQ